ncbi:MAG TPA: hypothetical protein VHX52_10165 [Steroidobacteraceae bacterium]|jgi:hypothetical protein|nr:hypothetical protein [Steroidobacteraceae bacterium]
MVKVKQSEFLDDAVEALGIAAPPLHTAAACFNDDGKPRVTLSDIAVGVRIGSLSRSMRT